MSDCERCDGCGKIADSDDGEAWTEWTSLPLHSAQAVVLGIVKPIPCPVCNGSGDSPGDPHAIEVAALREELIRVKAERDAAAAMKSGAYAERNKCVALIARMALGLGWRAGVGRHPAEDREWENDWRNIVFIHSPAGQLTWHFHDSELPLLTDLPVWTGEPWDGHTTPEKYDRVRRLP